MNKLEDPINYRKESEGKERERRVGVLKKLFKYNLLQITWYLFLGFQTQRKSYIQLSSTKVKNYLIFGGNLDLEKENPID